MRDERVPTEGESVEAFNSMGVVFDKECKSTLNFSDMPLLIPFQINPFQPSATSQGQF